MSPATIILLPPQPPWLSINVNSTEQKSVFCLASHTLMFNVIGLASTSSQLKIIAELLYDGTHFCALPALYSATVALKPAPLK